jgi:hypothetical protein
MFKPDQVALLEKFLDFCFDSFLAKNTPQPFLDELAGMTAVDVAVANVSRRFYTIANMPADAVNIVSMLEQEFEQGWPAWLKAVVNDIIKIIEKIINGCDGRPARARHARSLCLFLSLSIDGGGEPPSAPRLALPQCS